MKKNLMVVEKITQAEKLRNILGNDWDVIACGQNGVSSQYENIIVAFHWCTDHMEVVAMQSRYIREVLRNLLLPGCENNILVL